MTVLVVTVEGPAHSRRDLVVAADVPVAGMLPTLAALVLGAGAGPGPHPHRGCGWALVTPAGRVVSGDETLSAVGVLDGMVLRLVPTSVVPGRRRELRETGVSPVEPWPAGGPAPGSERRGPWDREAPARCRAPARSREAVRPLTGWTPEVPARRPAPPTLRKAAAAGRGTDPPEG